MTKTTGSIWSEYDFVADTTNKTKVGHTGLYWEINETDTEVSIKVINAYQNSSTWSSLYTSSGYKGKVIFDGVDTGFKVGPISSGSGTNELLMEDIYLSNTYIKKDIAYSVVARAEGIMNYTVINGTYAGTTLSGTCETENKWFTIPALATYTIMYDNNGGSGSASSITKYHGQAITLPSSTGFSKSGYKFGGWCSKEDGSGTVYGAGTSFNYNGNITLYVVWVPDTYTVSFNVNWGGGQNPPSQQFTYDTTYSDLPVPTRDGYNFSGWYLENTPIRDGDTVSITEDSTFTAHWNETTTTYIKTENGWVIPSQIYYKKDSSWNGCEVLYYKTGNWQEVWKTSYSLTLKSYDGTETYLDNMYVPYKELKLTLTKNGIIYNDNPAYCLKCSRVANTPNASKSDYNIGDVVWNATKDAVLYIILES